MKKFNSLQLLLGLALVIAFWSCAPKYGAHFSSSEDFYKPEEKHKVAVAPAVALEEIKEILDDQTTAKPDQLVVSNEKIIPVVPNPSIVKLVEKHEKQMEKLENSQLEGKKLDKALKKEKKRAKKEIRKEVKKEITSIAATNQDDDYVLMMVLAVLVPPLAVGLTYGIVDKFWISLLLTLLFFIPGVVYALIVVNDHYR